MTPIRTDEIAPHSVPPKYIIPDCFREFNELIALQSTRIGGISKGPYSSLNLGINTEDNPEHVHENTLRLCATAGINPERMVSSEQVHGTKILYAETPGRYHGYDAFITDRINLFLYIFTADCYPILLFDPQHKAVGAVHAGWKGSAGKIVMKTIEHMHTKFNSIPAECVAFIGTGISGDAYEVGPDVAKEFPQKHCKHSNLSQNEGKYMLDLSMVNHQQLIASGIPASNIERSSYCSYRESNLFFSYRRDNGKTGRMASIIGVR
ncbi:MAG: peptidoglycan editing factor PgeF [Chlorobiales bacterium]|nr:peptidoglycan editing factor PgeF [Chlorobiales bacterium]